MNMEERQPSDGLARNGFILMLSSQDLVLKEGPQNNSDPLKGGLGLRCFILDLDFVLICFFFFFLFPYHREIHRGTIYAYGGCENSTGIGGYCDG